MITFKSSKKDFMSDVPISDIESEIKRVYASSKAIAIIEAFHELWLGRAFSKRNGEQVVHRCDVVNIFYQLEISIKLIDVNGIVLAIDGRTPMLIE
jgi:hypothetical protein